MTTPRRTRYFSRGLCHLLSTVLDKTLVESLALFYHRDVWKWIYEAGASLQHKPCYGIMTAFSVIRASGAFVREIITAQTLCFQIIPHVIKVVSGI
jgi:hypothetical protein